MTVCQDTSNDDLEHMAIVVVIQAAVVDASGCSRRNRKCHLSSRREERIEAMTKQHPGLLTCRFVSRKGMTHSRPRPGDSSVNKHLPLVFEDARDAEFSILADGIYRLE